MLINISFTVNYYDFATSEFAYISALQAEDRVFVPLEEPKKGKFITHYFIFQRLDFKKHCSVQVNSLTNLR
jgi:hypothetical protein